MVTEITQDQYDICYQKGYDDAVREIKLGNPSKYLSYTLCPYDSFGEQMAWNQGQEHAKEDNKVDTRR